MPESTTGVEGQPPWIHLQLWRLVGMGRGNEASSKYMVVVMLRFKPVIPLNKIFLFYPVVSRKLEFI